MQKIVDFRDHGIPIIEIKIAKSINIETYIDKNDIEGSIERGYQKINDIASNQLFCRVLSNPVSIEFHQDYVRQTESNRLEQAEKNRQDVLAIAGKYREAESLAADVSKQRDNIAEAKDLLAKNMAALVVSNDGLTHTVEQLNVELGKYKTAYTSRVNEIKSLKGELENAKAGFWTKLWRAISSEKA
jgi:hypothetical protein